MKTYIVGTHLECGSKTCAVLSYVEALSGGGRRGGVPVPLFPWKKSAFSLVPQNKNPDFLYFLFPKIAFVPIPFSFKPLFPCSLEINGLIPVFPKTPGRASMF